MKKIQKQNGEVGNANIIKKFEIKNSATANPWVEQR
jgi:hypothetical protein